MKQRDIFNDAIPKEKRITSIGDRLHLQFMSEDSRKVGFFNSGVLVRYVDLSDKVDKKLLVVDAVKLGANQSRLAEALKISRQTIHNYVAAHEQYGKEGLISSYTPSRTKNLKKRRSENSDKLPSGDKAKQLKQIRKEKRELNAQFTLPFGDQTHKIEPENQPFNEVHDWAKTRYAGSFAYLIALVSQNNWFRMIMSYFGDRYQVFMVFLLMVTQDIRSIEQLKNVHKREGGLIAGIKRIPSKLKVRESFHSVGKKGVSKTLLSDFFRHQIRNGIVGAWLWFTDGHLLPYSGKRKVHSSYNTQRRMMVPGQTNLVTTDSSGRIVDFEIQEGKGDLRGHLINLYKKWKNEVPQKPIMVFDREGYGAKFFSFMNENQVSFVTWEKHIDSKKINEIEDERFNEEFEFNTKTYRIFEGVKSFSYTDDMDQKHEFSLRRIYIWNVTSNRRTCALSNEHQERLSTKECAIAILSRWGASENTFKHLVDRHPFHYRPGFKFVESEKQDIPNPELKEKRGLLTRMKRSLNTLLKKMSKSKEIFNKDGSVRQNSSHQRLKKELLKQEAEIEQLSKQIAQLPERVDISSMEDYSCFNRISNEGKNLFDFVTSSVWNIRKLMAEWLFAIYENKNEYIDLFYAITKCHGWIKSEKTKVTVRLEPLQQPSRRAAQEQFCRKLNGLNAITPTGKALVIEVGDSPIL